MIKADHIRFARTTQLAKLLRISHTTISEWIHRRGFNDRSLEPAVQLGIPKDVLVAGIEAKRQDAALARQYQQELDQFLLGQECQSPGDEVA